MNTENEKKEEPKGIMQVAWGARANRNEPTAGAAARPSRTGRWRFVALPLHRLPRLRWKISL